MRNKTVELVKAFQAGDRDAFELLVREHQNLVTSIAFAHLADLQQSEDTAQNTFLIAWQKQDELREPSKFASWIGGIARNLSRNQRRRKHRQRSAGQIEAGEVEPTAAYSDPQLESERREQQQFLWAALERIPVEYREPMILYYREQHSVRAVADLLDLTEDAVKQRLHRGRKMLRQELEQTIEKTLAETSPKDVFAATVLAGVSNLPKISAGTAMTTAAAAPKVATGLTTVSASGLLGILGGLSGFLFGLGGAWFGVRASAKQSTSEDERKLHWRLFAWIVLITTAYTVVVLAAVLNQAYSSTLAFATNVVFLVSLLGSIGLFLAKQKSLHKIHGSPQDKFDSVSISTPVSLGAFRGNAVGMLVGVWSWLIVMGVIAKMVDIAVVAGVLMLLQIGWVWRIAPRLKRAQQQARANGHAALIACGLQALLVVWTQWSYPVRWGEVAGDVPSWLIVLAILAIGICVFCLTEQQARRIEQGTD